MDTEKARNFIFEKSGAMVLILLSDKDLSFNELKAAIKASPNTVLARLREAMQIGIAEEKLVRTGRRALIKYTLTREGREFVNNLNDFKKHFTAVNEELNKIKEEEQKKETEIAEILSSMRQSANLVSINGKNTITVGRDVIINSGDSNTNKERKRNKTNKFKE